MMTILCLCLAFLGHAQFVGSQQPSVDSGFSMGTDTTGTQTGISSFPPSSPGTQSGFSSPPQRNDLSQTGNSFSGDSTNPFSSTGTSWPAQSNSSLAQGGVSSPTQPGLSPTGVLSTAQSNDPFSQTGFTSQGQTNPSNSFNGFTAQNSSGPNAPNSLSGVFSPTASNDPFSQGNAFPSSPSSSLPPTQPNPAISQNGPVMSNQFPNSATQNSDALSSQTGLPNTQNNGFSSTGTDPSASPATFPSSFSNNSTTTQAAASPSSMQLVLATMLSGQYSTREQYEDDNARNVTGANKHALMEVTYIPVPVRALGHAVVFYYEQRINNSAQPARQAIYAFSQESACLIRMSTYDIANASRFSVSPTGLQALETLTLAELSNREECDAFWEQVDDEFFTSYLSTDQCTFEVSPRVVVRPSGSRNLTCSGMTFTEVWRRAVGNDVVGGSAVPYVFKKTGNAFPVPVNVFSSNACFKVPCMNSGVATPAGPGWGDIKPHMNYAATANSTVQATPAL